MTLAKQKSRSYGVKPVCEALNVSRATYYRRLKPPKQHPNRRTSARRLSDVERQHVLDVLTSERFMDKSPDDVYATLLDEGTYLCGVRTMYRILAENKAVRERRNQRRHPKYVKPQLVATAPNQVWSWDITKLKGPGKWEQFYLYVLIDIYSRFVVGWLLARNESARLAERLIQESCFRQNIARNQITLHSDRGTAMRSKTVAQLCADLSINPSFSRPRVCNDNPYSEAQFKTLKYRPDFPGRFGSFEGAKKFLRIFFPWYNNEHHHSGVAYMTPEDVHYGRALAICQKREGVLTEAHKKHPERFVNGKPKPKPLPLEVWINNPDAEAS